MEGEVNVQMAKASEIWNQYQCFEGRIEGRMMMEREREMRAKMEGRRRKSVWQRY
ncbi:hypothetical protein HRbin04_01153 [archaeon HR04]|nr:hypothetical protein HRbin04_01153 [archaeon HR04]